MWNRPKEPQELPDDQSERVKILLPPDAQATLLQKEKPTAPQDCLAATYAYKILNKFGPRDNAEGPAETVPGKGQTVGHLYHRTKYLGQG